MGRSMSSDQWNDAVAAYEAQQRQRNYRPAPAWRFPVITNTDIAILGGICCVAGLVGRWLQRGR